LGHTRAMLCGGLLAANPNQGSGTFLAANPNQGPSRARRRREGGGGAAGAPREVNEGAGCGGADKRIYAEGKGRWGEQGATGGGHANMDKSRIQNPQSTARHHYRSPGSVRRG
jgi:hypothetical protein